MTLAQAPNGSVAAPVRGRLLLVAGLLVAAFTAPFARGQTGSEAPPTVEDVLVVGLRHLTLQQVKAQLRTVAGQPLNPGLVREDLDALSAMRTFDKPWVEYKDGTAPKTVRVIFHVNEFPNAVREVIYKNAHHTRPEELDAITNLKRGMALNPGANQNACRAIIEYYKKEGRYFASCSLEEGANPNDTRVVFNITEGPVVRVRYISFNGNDELATSARLLTQVDNNPRWLLPQPWWPKFNPLSVLDDTGKLEDYYHSNGYLDARVTRELNFSDDHQFVDITFHIHEGLRYHVKDVGLKGVTVLPQEQIQSIIKLHKDDLYDSHVIEGDLRNVQDFYGYRGYPAVVTPKLVFADKKVEPGLVQVQYEVTEKSPKLVGEILIVGNDVTRNNVILRMLDIFPGQTLSYPALRAGERNLARSNLFDPEERPTISVIPREDGADSQYQDILVRVKETMTGSLMFGASVNSDAGLVGSIVLNERNFDITRFPTSLDDFLEGRAFRGGGQELRIEAVPGTQVQRYSISFREPYLFDLPYSLTTSGYYFDRSYTEYLESRYGFNAAISYQINRNWSVAAGFRIENVRITNVPFYAGPEFQEVVGDNFLVAPRVTVARDDRDSYLRPTEGGLVSFTYEQLLGDFTAPVLTAEASRFFTVYQRKDGSGRQVVALRSQVSWAGDDTPVYEHFYAGGIRSLRGFEFRGVGPIVNGLNPGGNFMFLNSVEYQLPVLANDAVYLVAFVDSGTVERTVSIHDYRVAAGVGARIAIPQMGQVPIALDFGFPIVRGPNDREQIFSFYVGFFR
jgi:outer membrane protein assembly complex protein YaeT